MDFALLSSISSTLLFIVFIGIVAWAYTSRNRDRFNEAAMLPFDDEEQLQPIRLAARHTHAARPRARGVRK